MANETRYVRPEDFRAIFANSFRMRLGNNDASITFGYQSTVLGGESVLTDEVEVILTPLGLKHLALSLQKVVERAEKDSGEIPVPDELKKQIENLFSKR